MNNSLFFQGTYMNNIGDGCASTLDEPPLAGNPQKTGDAFVGPEVMLDPRRVINYTYTRFAGISSHLNASLYYITFTR